MTLQRVLDSKKKRRKGPVTDSETWAGFKELSSPAAVGLDEAWRCVLDMSMSSLANFLARGVASGLDIVAKKEEKVEKQTTNNKKYFHSINTKSNHNTKYVQGAISSQPETLSLRWCCSQRWPQEELTLQRHDFDLLHHITSVPSSRTFTRTKKINEVGGRRREGKSL